MCSFLCEYSFHFSEIYFPRGQLPSHLVIIHLIVLETVLLPCRVAGPSYIPTSNAYVVHFLISVWPCYLFNHSVKCALTSHCGFNFFVFVFVASICICWLAMTLSIFSCPYLSSIYLSQENMFESLLHFPTG